MISNVTDGLLASFTDSVKSSVGSLGKIFDGLPNVRSICNGFRLFKWLFEC